MLFKKFSLSAVIIFLFSISAQAQTLAQPNKFQYVNAACAISPKEFSSWFVSGTVTKNGLVGFADSVNFPTDNTKCDFYKWAHQMFLWISSPVDGGILLDSPTFYDLNAVGTDSNGFTIYQYAANTAKARNMFALRGTKPQDIQPGGQAGGGDTLLTLNGSLVYFGIHANDVYAWFNTAMSNGAISGSSTFPINQAQVDSVVTYAGKNGAQIGDAGALSMELKTAWVDAATVGNVADYITISAMVPNYIKKSNTQWIIDPGKPTTPKTLALVGVHVVGTVQDHPEMVWATFEHRNNAPDNTFYFQDLSGKAQQVPYNSAGQWAFMKSGGTQAGALVAQMTVDKTTGNINATTGNTIQQNNVYRVNPWGSAPTQESAENNSELISLNLDILVMLGLAGDVRSNYFQVGAVWTRDGSIPSSPTDSQIVGSLLLANSTMETYHQQGAGNSNQGCFGCHNVAVASSSANSSAPSRSVQTSHVFNINNIPLVPAGTTTKPKPKK